MPWKKDTVMRISLWPVLVCGCLLTTLVGQTAYAFEPADESSGYSPTWNTAGGDEAELFEGGDEDAASGYQPVQYVGSGTAPMPEYGGNDPYGAYQPNAWPVISPYTQHNLEEMYNERGLWQYNAIDEEPRNVIGFDFLMAWGLRPGTQTIGAGTPPASLQMFSPNQNFLNTSTTTNSTTGTSTTTGNTQINGTNDQTILRYGPQSTAYFSNPIHYGVKARYGWENPDDSGFLMSGFFIAQNQMVHHAKAPGDPIGPLGSIAYNNGVDGVLALFDSVFDQYYDQQFWGADADFIVAPFFRRPNFKVSMTYGVKYLRVSETLSIHAQDSNSSGNFGGGEQIQFIPTGDPLPPVLDTWITSSTLSNLVGPSIGLKYDLGGNKFKIWGQTKLAAMVNMQQMRVYGQNAYGNTDYLVYGYTNFNNHRSATYISPVFDQTIYGEFPLFAMLPLVNRINFLNKSMFRIGWNFILVGESSRPANQIAYNFTDPTIRTNRTWFSISTVSFGLDWRF
jgi:hypothetical protein